MSRQFNPPSYAKLAIRAIHAMNSAGGFSFNSVGDEPTTGYMVSLPSENKPCEANARNVAAFLRTNPVSGNAYYGGWRDQKTGAVYLDISANIANWQEAIELALVNKQIAIYDVSRKTSIYIRSKRRQFTIRQRIAYHLRRAIRLTLMAEQCGDNSQERSRLLDNANDARSEAQDLSAQLGESDSAWYRRFTRLAKELRKHYA